MRKYLITEAFLSELKAVLGEAQAKLAAPTLMKLHQLEHVEDDSEEA